jgi:hypothetical protein
MKRKIEVDDNAGGSWLMSEKKIVSLSILKKRQLFLGFLTV